MKIIQIHSIIKGIEKNFPNEWKKYKNLLVSKNYFLINEEFLYGHKGMLNNTFDKLKLVKIDYDHHWWNWNGKERKDIKFILDQFIKGILENIKFCPYCGKMPLISYGINKDKRAYDLDHIYPWTKYPYLTFNLYNLIPSCKICNTIKNRNDLSQEGDYFHPYFGHIENNKVSIDNTKCFDSEYNFSDYVTALSCNHSKLFTLHDIYETAKDTENDVGFIINQSSRILGYGNYLNFMGIKDKKGFFFKNFYPEKSEDILKFANGKLKRDMIKSLKI